MATVDDVILRATLRQEVGRGIDEIVAQLRLMNRSLQATQRQSRQAARDIDRVGDQARQATRQLVRMTTAVLGLNAALRGTRGLAGAIRGIQGETKLLIGVFATLIPAAVPVAAVLTASFLSMASAVTTVTAAVGVLALGFSGIGEAVSALASGDMDKINEAFANLSGAGQDFARTLFGLKPILDTLRGTAQEALLPAVGQALQILSTLLPSVNALVAILGQALGQVALQLAAAFTSPGAQAFLQFIGDNAGQLNSITDTLITLGAAFANLTVGFAPLTATFGNSLTQLVNTFADFASGASGTLGQFLTYVEQAMPHVNDFFNTFGSVLLQLLTELGGPGIVVLDALTGILRVIGDLSPTIGALAQAIGVSLLGGVNALTPVIEAVGPLLGQVLVAAATALADTLVALAPAIGQIAQFLSQQLLAAVTALTPFLAPLGEAFLGVLESLEPLVPVALSLIPILGDTLLSIFAALTPVLVALVQALIPVVETLVGQLQPFLPQIVDGLGQVLAAFLPLIPVFLQLGLATLPLLPPLLQLAVAILPAIAGILVALTPLIQQFANAIATYVTPVINLLAHSLEGLAILFDKVTQFFQDGGLQKVGDFLGKVGGSIGGAVGGATVFGQPIFGDTAIAHGSGDLGSTMAAHGSLMGGGVAISNALIGGGGRGYGSGDHQAGRALDLVGPGTGAYAARARAAGHFAQFHGTGGQKHLHVAYRRPMGDTATSMVAPAVAAASSGGVTVAVYGNVYGVDDFQRLIVDAVNEKDRVEAARRKS